MKETVNNKNMLIVGAIVIVLLGTVFMMTRSQNTEMAPTTDTMMEGSQEVGDAMVQETLDDTAMMDDTEDTEMMGEGDVVEVSLTGDNFSFSQEEIRVKQGDTVKITFESTDGFHDWVVDEFDAATEQVNPGTVTTTEFVADQAGTFEYYCSVGEHRTNGMVGNLIVE